MNARASICIWLWGFTFLCMVCCRADHHFSVSENSWCLPLSRERPKWLVFPKHNVIVIEFTLRLQKYCLTNLIQIWLFQYILSIQVSGCSVEHSGLDKNLGQQFDLKLFVSPSKKKVKFVCLVDIVRCYFAIVSEFHKWWY